MILGDVDVGNGALAGDLGQGILDRRSVRLLVELDRKVLGAESV